MGNEHSTPPAKKSSRASLGGEKERRCRSSSGTPQLAPPRIDESFVQTHGDCTPRLDRRPSCRNNNKLSTATDDMGQAGSRRNSRRSSAVGLPQENGKSSNGSLADAAKLTSYQCSLLVQSWPRIKSNNSTFTQAFKMLTFKSPTAREIFQKMSIVEGFKRQSSCDLAAHLKYLTELFDGLFADLNQPAKQAEARCYEIGVSHYNMTEKLAGNIWENLGEILTEVITRHDSVRQKREAVKAWIGIISYLVDIMKNGYVSEYRRRHARLSIGHADMAPGGLCPAQFQQQFSSSEPKPLAAGE
ncbi:hypothetical protein PMAYCL1PPCAC_28768 [Pristionchus mayeri]|uniref:Globin domain-containing protein n=1 Tax=Pristionchus mayeri TaxID=1317129 RepID=A0AAN5IAB2_9BILA|nr:hypothetical protein PMAYCL1PPCAC_28768 [Pristionchus mayeri]